MSITAFFFFFLLHPALLTCRSFFLFVFVCVFAQLVSGPDFKNCSLLLFLQLLLSALLLPAALSVCCLLSENVVISCALRLKPNQPVLPSAPLALLCLVSPHRSHM